MKRCFRYVSIVCALSCLAAPAAFARTSGHGGGRGGARSSSRAGSRGYSPRANSSSSFSSRGTTRMISPSSSGSAGGIAPSTRASFSQAFSSAPSSYRSGTVGAAHPVSPPKYSPVSPTAAVVGGGSQVYRTTVYRSGGGYSYPGLLAFGFAPVALYAGYAASYPAYPAGGLTDSQIYTPSPIVEIPAAPPPIPGAATASADLINAQGPPIPPQDPGFYADNPVQTFQLGDRAIVQVSGSVRLQDRQTAVVLVSDGRSFLTRFDPSVPGAQDFSTSPLVTVWLTPDSDGGYHLYQLRWSQVHSAPPGSASPQPSYPQMVYPPPTP